MKQEIKTRFKSHWKKLALAVIGLGTVVYFIVTGNEVDVSFLTELLQ